MIRGGAEMGTQMMVYGEGEGVCTDWVQFDTRESFEEKENDGGTGESSPTWDGRGQHASDQFGRKLSAEGGKKGLSRLDALCSFGWPGTRQRGAMILGPEEKKG